jgi:glycosyltransferase involved in cell wall biosynthesis
MQRMTRAERPGIVLATQEVWPFVQGGGIGRHVASAAALLADAMDVTVLTSRRFEEEHARLSAAADERIPPGVRFAWVDEPEGDLSPLLSSHHAWSVNCWRALARLAGERCIDLVEFDDYHGVGAVAIDAGRAGCTELADATLAVRLHTTWEMTAVLDAEPRDQLASRSVMALERLALRFADRLLHPAEATLAAYRRFYGRDALAPATMVPLAVTLGEPSGELGPATPQRRLRLLYAGRLERRKGVVELVRGMLALDDDAVELTLVGGDTATSPSGGSMRSYLERLADSDPRVTFRDQVSRDELAGLMRAHHVVVVPSHFESFGYVVREALAANRPVLGTPVGGIVEGFVPGRSGWLARDASAVAIAEALRDLAARRDEIAAVIDCGAPRQTIEATVDHDLLIRRYLELARPVGRPSTRPPRPPITAVITACADDGPLGPTLDGLDAQRWPDLEVIVVADDVERVPAGLLPRIPRLILLESDQDSRLVARRAGVSARRADGRHLLLLEAGDVIAPSFLDRCSRALASPARPAYATTYGDGRDPVNAPIGNAVSEFIGEHEVAASVALLRADVVAAASLESAPDGCEERVLYADLAAAGLFGAVVPEPLVRRKKSRCHDQRAASHALAAAAAGEDLWSQS